MEDSIRITEVVNLKTLLMVRAIEGTIAEDGAMTFLIPSKILEKFGEFMTQAQIDKMSKKNELYRELENRLRKGDYSDETFNIQKQIYEYESED